VFLRIRRENGWAAWHRVTPRRPTTHRAWASPLSANFGGPPYPSGLFFLDGETPIAQRRYRGDARPAIRNRLGRHQGPSL